MSSWKCAPTRLSDRLLEVEPQPPFPGLTDGLECGVGQSIDTVQDGCVFDPRETIRACLGWWT